MINQYLALWMLLRTVENFSSIPSCPLNSKLMVPLYLNMNWGNGFPFPSLQVKKAAVSLFSFQNFRSDFFSSSFKRWGG